jgi:hypothetical protein
VACRYDGAGRLRQRSTGRKHRKVVALARSPKQSPGRMGPVIAALDFVIAPEKA